MLGFGLFCKHSAGLMDMDCLSESTLQWGQVWNGLQLVRLGFLLHRRHEHKYVMMFSAYECKSVRLNMTVWLDHALPHMQIILDKSACLSISKLSIIVWSFTAPSGWTCVLIPHRVLSSRSRVITWYFSRFPEKIAQTKWWSLWNYCQQ